MLAKGARFVVVINLPDASQTPFALSLDAQTRGLINTMVTTFNSQLQAGLNGAGVLYVDEYTQGRLQTANPAQFGLTNVTTPACSTTSPANPLAGSSITCTQASLIPGDTSGFLFADSVHPTPLGYQLLANHVIAQMRAAGWLLMPAPAPMKKRPAGRFFHRHLPALPARANLVEGVLAEPAVDCGVG